MAVVSKSGRGGPIVPAFVLVRFRRFLSLSRVCACLCVCVGVRVCGRAVDLRLGITVIDTHIRTHTAVPVAVKLAIPFAATLAIIVMTKLFKSL